MLIVVRHGESVWNKLNKFTGLTDVELSDIGRTEAENVSTILKDQTFDFIFSSSLKRCRDTADIINNRKKTQINIINELCERDYGDLTGKNKEELKQQFGEDQVNIWRRSYMNGPPNGENLKKVSERVGNAYKKNIEPFVKEGKNILIVAHGNSIRSLFVYLGIKSPLEIENFEIGTCIPVQLYPDTCTYRYINEYELSAFQILDSRGYPTIEVQCKDKIKNTFVGRGSTPSGASCGSTEVCEIRDNNKSIYDGKSIYDTINRMDSLKDKLNLSKKSLINLSDCDKQIIELDGTEMKTNIGGNTSTAMSFCFANTASNLKNIEMYQYFMEHYKLIDNINYNKLPTPFVNIINGGKHGVTENLKIQEFMIFAKDNMIITDQIRMYCEIYYNLKKLLVVKYGEQAKSIGDEGGFCPPIYSADEALCVIEEAIYLSEYKIGEDVFIALDCAASEFYDIDTKLYQVEKDKFLNSNELIEYYETLIEKHPALKSIEDGFHETDYDAWKKFTYKFSDKLMIVGDDLFTTNPKLIKKGIDNKWANTLLLKVNQIGTISEAIKSAKMMIEKGNDVIVSHRSGETNHAYIVDLAVGIGARYLKIGSPCRGERVSKFNRLLEIFHQYNS